MWGAASKGVLAPSCRRGLGLPLSHFSAACGQAINFSSGDCGSVLSDSLCSVSCSFPPQNYIRKHVRLIALVTGAQKDTRGAESYRRLESSLQPSCGVGLRAMAVQPSNGMTQCRMFSSGMRNTRAGIKNPYWRHRGFWEWRRRDITALNRRMRARKHIFPRHEMEYLPPWHPLRNATFKGEHSEKQAALFNGTDKSEQDNESTVQRRSSSKRTPRRLPGGFLYNDSNATYVEDLSYLAAPKKGDGRVWVARRRDIPMGRKRLLLLLRLIKGLQLTDAIDWLQALALHRCNSLLNLLLKQQELIRDEGADAARVYIQSYMIGPAGHVKTMKVGHNYRVSFLKSYRYSLALRLRELPLHELFHRTFILKNPPRSLTHDMRLALHQKQLPPEVVRDWIPYLDAKTRYTHKRRLRVLDRQRLFNYFLARRAFVCTYTSRLRQMNEEAAAARGTSLNAVQQMLGSKRQLKGIDIPEN